MAKLRLKKIKKRKKYKLIYLLLIIYIVFAYTFYYSFKSISNDTNQLFVNFLINSGYFINDFRVPKIISNSLGYLLKIDITKPITLFNHSVIGLNTDNEKLSDKEIETLKQVSYYFQDPFNRNVNDPIVYIYNSHQLENYDNTNLAIYGITPNVLMASYLLKEKLNDLGVPTICEDTNMTEFLELNHWSYDNSYRASRIFILDKQNTYSTLKYFIDIHRDSVSRDISTVKIGNKQYARILFVIGLEHEKYHDNLMVSEKINNLFNKYYPGLSRGIYKKEGPNVNGIYNQDIDKNVMLIEVGGVNNNINEVVNTINAISDILVRYINNE